MRRHLRNGSLVSCAGVLAFVLAGACGHSEDHLNASKDISFISTGNTGNTGEVPGVGGSGNSPGQPSGGSTGLSPTSACPEVPPSTSPDTVVPMSQPAPGARMACGCGNMPPDPTRIRLVPPAMCAITTDVAALAIPAML